MCIRDSGYNEVNGKAEVIKIENRDYDALENITLTLKIKNGWDYTCLLYTSRCV